MQDFVNTVGTIAATLTTISFLPQTVKVIRTKHTKDLSLVMYILLTVGIALWTFYGVLFGQWPIIISNIVALPLTATILYMKLREK